MTTIVQIKNDKAILMMADTRVSSKKTRKPVTNEITMLDQEYEKMYLLNDKCVISYAGDLEQIREFHGKLFRSSGEFNCNIDRIIEEANNHSNRFSNLGYLIGGWNGTTLKSDQYPKNPKNDRVNIGTTQNGDKYIIIGSGAKHLTFEDVNAPTNDVREWHNEYYRKMALKIRDEHVDRYSSVIAALRWAYIDSKGVHDEGFLNMYTGIGIDSKLMINEEQFVNSFWRYMEKHG